MGVRARNLDVVAHSEIQGEVRPYLPVVLEEHAGLPPAIGGLDRVADVYKVGGAKEEAGGRVARAGGNRDRLSIGKTGSVQSRLGGLEGDRSGGQAALVSLQPAHLTAHCKCVVPANQGQVVVDDVSILGVERSARRTDAVLGGADSDIRIGAVWGRRPADPCKVQEQ